MNSLVFEGDVGRQEIREGAAAYSTYLLAVLPPLALCIFWHFLNRAYPGGDSAEFIAGSVWPHVLDLKSGEEGNLWKLYWFRIWNPFALPFLLSPFLWVTENVRLSVSLFNLLFYGVFLIYVARFLKWFMADFFAVLGTWFVGTLPWILLSAYYFMGELPFLAASMAVVYCLFENKWVISKRRCLMMAACLGLAFCVRPFEAAVTIGPIYVLFVIRACRAGEVSAMDVWRAVLMTVFVLAVPWVFEFSKASNAASLAGVLCGWALVAGAASSLGGKRIRSDNFILMHTVFLSLFLLWFAPFYKRLFYFAFSATYGLPTMGPATDNLLAALFRMARGHLVFPLLTLAVLGRFIGPRPMRPIPGDIKLLAAVCALSFGSVPFLLWTQNQFIRYHYIGVTLLSILAFVVVAGRTSPGRDVMKFVLAVVCFGQAFWAVGSFRDEARPAAWKKIFYDPSVYAGYYRNLLSPRLEEGDVRDLLGAMSRFIPLDAHVRVLTFVDFSQGFLEVPEEFTLVAREMGYKAYFTFPHGLSLDGKGVDAALDWQRIHADYLLIEVLPEQGCPVPIDWIDLIGEVVLRSWKAGRLEAHGLAFQGRFPWAGRRSDFLVFRAIHP